MVKVPPIKMLLFNLLVPKNAEATLIFCPESIYFWKILAWIVDKSSFLGPESTKMNLCLKIEKKIKFLNVSVDQRGWNLWRRKKEKN